MNPRHNVRRHLGSGFLHGVGRHVLPVTPGGNPAWGYPRCCRQDQSRSGQDQIRSKLLGHFHWNERSNGWGTARFAERDDGRQRPASMGKELGTWPTSQPPHISLFFRYCQALSFVFSSPLQRSMPGPATSKSLLPLRQLRPESYWPSPQIFSILAFTTFYPDPNPAIRQKSALRRSVVKWRDSP